MPKSEKQTEGHSIPIDIEFFFLLTASVILVLQFPSPQQEWEHPSHSHPTQPPAVETDS